MALHVFLIFLPCPFAVIMTVPTANTTAIYTQKRYALLYFSLWVGMICAIYSSEIVAGVVTTTFYGRIIAQFVVVIVRSEFEKGNPDDVRRLTCMLLSPYACRQTIVLPV